jgi:hypothetical protein
MKINSAISWMLSELRHSNFSKEFRNISDLLVTMAILLSYYVIMVQVSMRKHFQELDPCITTFTL